MGRADVKWGEGRCTAKMGQNRLVWSDQVGKALDVRFLRSDSQELLQRECQEAMATFQSFDLPVRWENVIWFPQPMFSSRHKAHLFWFCTGGGMNFTQYALDRGGTWNLSYFIYLSIFVLCYVVSAYSFSLQVQLEIWPTMLATLTFIFSATTKTAKQQTEMIIVLLILSYYHYLHPGIQAIYSLYLLIVMADVTKLSK